MDLVSSNREIDEAGASDAYDDVRDVRDGQRVCCMAPCDCTSRSSSKPSVRRLFHAALLCWRVGDLPLAFPTFCVMARFACLVSLRLTLNGSFNGG